MRSRAPLAYAEACLHPGRLGDAPRRRALARDAARPDRARNGRARAGDGGRDDALSGASAREWLLGEREDQTRDRMKRAVRIGARTDTAHRGRSGEAEHGLSELQPQRDLG